MAAILGAHSPDGVIELAIVVVVLQVEHFEVASLLVVERHGVADAAECMLVVGRESIVGVVVHGRECLGGACPVLLCVASKVVVAARSERGGCCGKATAHQTGYKYFLDVIHIAEDVISLNN